MGGGIGQYALYRAEDGSLCLFSLVVPAGAATPVHDHLAWGLVGIYRGRQDETVYRRLDDGRDPSRARARDREAAGSSAAASSTRCCRRPTTFTTSGRSPTRRRSRFTFSRTTPRASGAIDSIRPTASSRRFGLATPTRRVRRTPHDGRRLSDRRRQHAARQRRGHRRSPAPSASTRSALSASAATGRSSRSCAASSATPTISARSSDIASRIRASRHLLRISLYLLHYPFAIASIPARSTSSAACGESGPVVILSDGDVVFQPRKVERSGLWAAVGGEVLIYIHKEQMLDDVERRYPARALRHDRRQAADPRRHEGASGAIA